MDLTNLENFLKTHSKINKKFIEDFFGFQKRNELKEYEPFIIDLEDVCFWLEAKKGNLKDTLIGSYIKDFDYIVIKNWVLGEQKPKTHNNELILLTSDCFKMLCMRSNTKKANQVRQYYIELEKLLDKYKEIIVENLNKKISVLEKDLKNEKYDLGDTVYIYKEIDELGEIYFRVGETENLNSRLIKHNSSSVHKKELFVKIKTTHKKHLEECIKAHLYQYRYKDRKDYFKANPRLIKKAIGNCKIIVKDFTNKNNNREIEQTGGISSNKKNSDKIMGVDVNDPQFDYKVNIKVKKALSNYSDNIMYNVFEKPSEAYFHGKKIPNKMLNYIVLPQTESDKILVLPAHRDSEVFLNLKLEKNQYTYAQLFEILNKFYMGTQVDKTFLSGITSDFFEYKKDALRKIKLGKKVFLIDLIGNMCRFESVYLLNEQFPHVFTIFLGS